MTGILIAFEGGEGAGKSTQIKLLERALNHDVLVTRQPGGTALGQTVRQLVLDGEPGTVDDRAEALLYAADRAQHVAEVVRPALAAGRTVISDRWADSSIAYQAAGRGMDRDWIAAVSAWAAGGLVPDLTVLLDIDPAVGLARAARRGATDRLEQENLDFHRRVRGAYLELVAEAPGRYLVLDATRPVDEIARSIGSFVRGLLSVGVGA
ncbi:dTMP kinase [Dactylosporangium sp. CA-139066]|uniref:dTMP kinase n=1 Tax=Dactylosporangium sp. CA-139066 TaxID=3239930 RepID=UPI003D8F4DF0